jgi:hypothetical protein
VPAHPADWSLRGASRVRGRTPRSALGSDYSAGVGQGGKSGECTTCESARRRARLPTGNPTLRRAAMDRSVVDLPVPAPPIRSQCFPAARSNQSGRCCWLLGRSHSPTGTRSPDGSDSAYPASWSRVSRCGSGGSHGLGGGPRPLAVAATSTAATSRRRSEDRARIGRSGRRTGSPRVARVRRPGRAGRRRSTVICPAWKATGVPAPTRRYARPGCCRGSGGVRTVDDVVRVSRIGHAQRVRRLVFARSPELTTPAGRCVARTRDAERPPR